MSPALLSSVFFGAIPVAALTTHCKIDFFWEVMVGCRHLVVLSWCPSTAFSVVISDKESLYIVYPLVNEVSWQKASSYSSHTRSSGSADSIEALTSSPLR